jgi:hypothetical protein
MKEILLHLRSNVGNTEERVDAKNNINLVDSLSFSSE